MCRFGIITPTIGRDVLKRCLLTMKHQVYRNFLHIVVGDGKQNEWVRKECEENQCYYFETNNADKFYGAGPRNAALDLIESGKLSHFDYIFFLDDDNILLEPALYNAAKIVCDNNAPPLMWQDILFTNKYNTTYYILPNGKEPLHEGDWDNLNCFYRSDIILGNRFERHYSQDYLFSKSASEKCDHKWIKCPGVGGIHFLSWDTFEHC